MTSKDLAFNLFLAAGWLFIIAMAWAVWIP